jgi:penicillin amidase
MGRVPVPGWIAKYDWEGTMPFDKLPVALDPASGRIVTANHKITPPGYQPFIVGRLVPAVPRRPHRGAAGGDAEALAGTRSRDAGATAARASRASAAVHALAAKPATRKDARRRGMLKRLEGRHGPDRPRRWSSARGTASSRASCTPTSWARLPRAVGDCAWRS